MVTLALLAVLATGLVIAPIALIVYSARERRLLRGLLAAVMMVAATSMVAIVILLFAALSFYKTQIPDPQPRPPEELLGR